MRKRPISSKKGTKKKRDKNVYITTLWKHKCTYRHTHANIMSISSFQVLFYMETDIGLFFVWVLGEESSILTPHGKWTLGWLPWTLWHLYLTNRLIIGWLNKSCPFRIDFCPRQMMYTWHQEIRSLERQSLALSASSQLNKSCIHPERVTSPDNCNNCNYDIGLMNYLSIDWFQ